MTDDYSQITFACVQDFRVGQIIYFGKNKRYLIYAIENQQTLWVTRIIGIWEKILLTLASSVITYLCLAPIK